MFTEKEIRELLDVSTGKPVLSVYLNTDPTAGNADSYKLRLRNLLKNIGLTDDVQVVENFFSNEFNWVGRGVAVFSCTSCDLFKTYSLAIPIQDLAVAGDQPAITPLIDLLDDFGGIGVALVDKQSARLFNFHVGELIEQEEITGEEVKHVKLGGASSFPGRRGGQAGQTRHQETLVERNIKELAELASRFFEKNHIRRVLIGGTDETIAQFQAALPKSWQALISGTFPMSMTANNLEVLAKAIRVGQESHLKHEQSQVSDLITLASKGGNAIIGLENVLQSIFQDRVHTLIVNDDFKQPGKICPSCNWMTGGKVKTCRNCTEPTQPVEDVVEIAVNQVWKLGGSVVITSNNSQLAQAGGIGAMLRY